MPVYVWERGRGVHDPRCDQTELQNFNDKALQHRSQKVKEEKKKGSRWSPLSLLSAFVTLPRVSLLHCSRMCPRPQSASIAGEQKLQADPGFLLSPIPLCGILIPRNTLYWELSGHTHLRIRLAMFTLIPVPHYSFFSHYLLLYSSLIDGACLFFKSISFLFYIFHSFYIPTTVSPSYPHPPSPNSLPCTLQKG